MRPFVRLFPVLLVFGATSCLCAAPIRAAAQNNEYVPAEITALVVDVSDIDKLRVLNPLDLTPEQLGRLIEMLKKEQDIFLKNVTSAAVPPMRDMAAEIKSLRKKLLTGGEIPADFDNRVKKIQADFMARRDTQEQKTLKSVSDQVRAILKPAQIEKAISLAKTLTKRDGKPTMKGTDDQFFNFYVKGTFLDYGPIVPLLEDIKKAKESAGGLTANVKEGASGQKVARK